MNACGPSKEDLKYLVFNKVEPLELKIKEIAGDMIMLLGMLDNVERTTGITHNLDSTLPKLEDKVSISCSNLKDILNIIKTRTHFV